MRKLLQYFGALILSIYITTLVQKNKLYLYLPKDFTIEIGKHMDISLLCIPILFIIFALFIAKFKDNILKNIIIFPIEVLPFALFGGLDGRPTNNIIAYIIGFVIWAIILLNNAKESTKDIARPFFILFGVSICILCVYMAINDQTSGAFGLKGVGGIGYVIFFLIGVWFIQAIKDNPTT